MTHALSTDFAQSVSARDVKNLHVVVGRDGGMDIHLARPCTLAVQYAARRQEEDIWAAERRFVAGLPAKERERLRRIDALQGTAIDASHPPTNLRTALLRKSPDASARPELSAEESIAIARELSDAKREIARRFEAGL